MLMIDRELTCILSLSLCLMLLFTADSTVGNMQKIIVSSISDDDPSFTVEGYTVIAVVYTMSAVSLWFGPYVSYALGPKLTMTLSAIGYLSAIVPLLLENQWMIYGGAFVNGIACGCLWPAHGHYMIENSSPQTMARNVGIFWTIYTTSSLWGNLFVYYKFYGKKYIDQSTRRAVLSFLLVVNIVGVAAFMTLPRSSSDQKTVNYGLIKTVKKCWEILFSYQMFWLMFLVCYAGIQQSFLGGIYSSSIGFTLAFGNSAKELVALSGIVSCLGSLIGGICCIILSRRIRSHSYGRRLFVLFGCAAELLAYLITFANLPDNAVFGNTDQLGLISPSATLAMTGSLLLGFGNSCLNTQIFFIVADLYRENSAEACALVTFVKAVILSVCFYACSHIGLHIQLAILTATAVVGVICFFVAENGIANLPERSLQTQGCVNSDSEQKG
uniref:UNC93-like protein MFSD11 n=1 Tax=Graphocephala atropunctata TaxID=36148 RepID=A0A1B6LL39_9HEMI